CGTLRQAARAPAHEQGGWKSNLESYYCPPRCSARSHRRLRRQRQARSVGGPRSLRWHGLSARRNHLPRGRGWMESQAAGCCAKPTRLRCGEVVSVTRILERRKIHESDATTVCQPSRWLYQQGRDRAELHQAQGPMNVKSLSLVEHSPARWVCII